MPLNLRPPRKGKTPNYEIRGTYLGVYVEQSSGTPDKAVAEKQLNKIRRHIEDFGCWPPAPEVKTNSDRTFLSAVEGYLLDDGDRRYLPPLVTHFKKALLSEIDQDAINAAALALYPGVTPATRSRQVYTPISAILHHALGDKCPVIRRPKGSKGRMKTDFMWPQDAFAIIEEADKIDAEFGLYLRMLIYTGICKSEGLNLLTAIASPKNGRHGFEQVKMKTQGCFGCEWILSHRSGIILKITLANVCFASRMADISNTY